MGPAPAGHTRKNPSQCFLRPEKLRRQTYGPGQGLRAWSGSMPIRSHGPRPGRAELPGNYRSELAGRADSGIQVTGRRAAPGTARKDGYGIRGQAAEATWRVGML